MGAGEMRRQEKQEGWGAAARPLEEGESWAGGGRKQAEGREGSRPCLDAEFLMGEISTILCRDITSAKAGEGKAWGAT